MTFKLSDIINSLLLIFLSMYIFFGEFLTGITHVGVPKMALMGLSIIFFIFSLFVDVITKFEIKLYLGFLVTIVVYFIWWGPVLGNYNLFVTILYGYLFAKNKDKALLIIKIIFFIQFLAISYEFLSQSYIYKEFTTGLLNTSDVIDASAAMELFEDTGFRAKGIFAGTLVAASFVIFFALLFRNNLNLLFLNMIMAFIVNGRLGIMIASLTFILKLFKISKITFNSKKISNNLLVLIVGPIIILFSFIILYKVLPQTTLQNLFKAFDFTSQANAGRLFRMVQGYLLYLNEYSLLQKLFGNPEYQLVDIYNRPVPPEAELAGNLLEVGSFGLFIYIFALYKIYSRKEYRFYNMNFSSIGYNYVVIVNTIGILVYRHCSGNVRGVMFWMIIWIALTELKNKKELIASNTPEVTKDS